MQSSGDAAESIIRMTLNGFEVAAKISGSGAKNISVLLYTILKNQKQTRGKTGVMNMLKTGKELKVFSIKEEDLKRFTQQTKNYGVLFCALMKKGQRDSNGMIDVMVRFEDASKVNRIVSKFKIFTHDEASIKSEMGNVKVDNSKGVEIKSIDDKVIDDIFTKPIKKEENELSNPNVAKIEKSPLSEPLSTNIDNKTTDVGTKSSKIKKPSVREKIKEIKAEFKKKEELAKSDIKLDKKEQESPVKHMQPKNKKKKSKERGI